MEKERDHSGSHRRGTTLICQLISCSVPSISKESHEGLGKKIVRLCINTPTLILWFYYIL